MSTERVPLWLDCDPGHDDTFAILLAAYHPQIELLGISTVHGNASLDKTTNNALSVLTAIGKQDEITIYPGAAKALYRPPIHAPTDIHGESGLDGTSLLPQSKAKANTSVSAVDAMAAALRAQPAGKAWVIATGAVTNVGALFLAHPELAEHVAGVSIMGGAIGNKFTPAPLGVVDGVPRIGNWTPWAEFNILIDPEAASIVFSNPVLAAKTSLIPLDLTHLVLATQEVQANILYGADAEKTTEDIAEAYKTTGIKGKTDLRTMLVELLNFFAGTYRDVFGIVEGPPLHDPLAVAIALIGTASEIPFYDFDPASVEGPKRRERFEVTVVTEGTLLEAQAPGSTLQTGRTLAKLLEPGAEGVRIPRGLDIPLFWKVIEECCQRADEANAKTAAVAGKQ
ncbi:Inosine/uridine-preferring nucleoside hydrolase domain-containing protein [Microdochium bolleyi]|uniref:Inosine/uridine-preferring nucleoside hydrolase domain-containing protein n=1 Tax=Microdochium bolleyi TaxID=196109 RepID=A0A136JEA3_9PEZI|nr:Inosine/uridine-preferring nucleoside hydrolase domain-containing protein [Microdochium bolleyi]